MSGLLLWHDISLLTDPGAARAVLIMLLSGKTFIDIAKEINLY
jgi:hypothetical protein